MSLGRRVWPSWRTGGDANVLLVAAYRRDLRASDLGEWQSSLGDRLAGVLVNGLTRYLGTEAKERLLPSLDEAGIPLIGLIPEDRMLLSVTVDEVRSGLNGRYVVDEGDVNAPIEWFQVGAMTMDPGELRFGLYENNAVVVRGDRPDIQMSALNASVSCLVLTGGIEPIEYITYEAGEEEVPVMVVETDTDSTMLALNDITTHARMNNSRKVQRFAELLRNARRFQFASINPLGCPETRRRRGRLPPAIRPWASRNTPRSRCRQGP